MNTAIGRYTIVDTLYPGKPVSTGRPLVTYHAAHEWAMLRNIACGMPFRYAVRQQTAERLCDPSKRDTHAVATLKVGAL